MVALEELVSTVNRVELDRWTVPLVNGAIITLKLNTGAKARLINELNIRLLSTIPVKAYSRQPSAPKAYADTYESLSGEKLGLVKTACHAKTKHKAVKSIWNPFYLYFLITTYTFRCKIIINVLGEK